MVNNTYMDFLEYSVNLSTGFFDRLNTLSLSKK